MMRRCPGYIYEGDEGEVIGPQRAQCREPNAWWSQVSIADAELKPSEAGINTVICDKRPLDQ